MKVRLLVTLTGTRNGEYWPKVDGIVDLPDHEAAKLIRSGHAAAADAPVRKRRGKKVPASVVLDEPESLAAADQWKPVRDG